MNSNSTRALALVVAAILVIVAVVLIVPHSDDGATADPTGTWYQIGYYGYHDGVYYTSDDRGVVIYDYDLIITEIRDGVFYGMYSDSLITGSMIDGIITFYGTFGDYRVWFYGHYDGQRIYAVSTEDGVDCKSHYLVYDRDVNATCTNSSTVDIAGDWSAFSAVSYSQGEAAALEGTGLSIGGQTGCAFFGHFEEIVGSAVGEVYFSGSMLDMTVNGYRLGYILDATGVNWTVLANNDRIIFRTAVGDDGQFAIQREYSRDGTGSDADAYEIGLLGTSWNSQYTHGADYSKLYDRYVEYRITFEEQDWALLSGEIAYNGNVYDMCGYVYSTSPLLLGFSATHGNQEIRGLLTRTADGLQLVEWYDDGLCTDVTVFDRYDGGQIRPDDIAHHWYAIKSLGRTTAGTSFTSGIAYGSMDYLYSLRIVEASDGLFRGYFHGTYIAGTYADDDISFNAVLDNGDRIMFAGAFLSKNIIDASIIYYDAAKDVYLAYRTVYSATLIEGWVTGISTAMKGSWTSPEGYSVSYNDGIATPLLGAHLTIKTASAVLYGTMEQEVAGQLAQKNIVGVLRGSDAAYIVDETGLVYYATLADGTLRLRAIVNLDTGEVGRQSVGERVYTADGSAPAAQDYPELQGTVWQSSSFVSLDVTGKTADHGDLRIEITAQYHDLISGTVTLNGVSYEMYGYIVSEQDGQVILCMSMFGRQIFTGETACIVDGSMTITGSTDENGAPLAYRVVLVRP